MHLFKGKVRAGAEEGQTSKCKDLLSGILGQSCHRHREIQQTAQGKDRKSEEEQDLFEVTAPGGCPKKYFWGSLLAGLFTNVSFCQGILGSICFKILSAIFDSAPGINELARITMPVFNSGLNMAVAK